MVYTLPPYHITCVLVWSEVYTFILLVWIPVYVLKSIYACFFLIIVYTFGPRTVDGQCLTRKKTTGVLVWCSVQSNAYNNISVTKTIHRTNGQKGFTFKYKTQVKVFYHKWVLSTWHLHSQIMSFVKQKEKEPTCGGPHGVVSVCAFTSSSCRRTRFTAHIDNKSVPSAGEMETPSSTVSWVKHLLTVGERLCAECGTLWWNRQHCNNDASKVLVHLSAAANTSEIRPMPTCVKPPTRRVTLQFFKDIDTQITTGGAWVSPVLANQILSFALGLYIQQTAPQYRILKAHNTFSSKKRLKILACVCMSIWNYIKKIN